MFDKEIQKPNLKDNEVVLAIKNGKYIIGMFTEADGTPIPVFVDEKEDDKAE